MTPPVYRADSGAKTDSAPTGRVTHAVVLFGTRWIDAEASDRFPDFLLSQGRVLLSVTALRRRVCEGTAYVPGDGSRRDCGLVVDPDTYTVHV